MDDGNMFSGVQFCNYNKNIIKKKRNVSTYHVPTCHLCKLFFEDADSHFMKS